LPYRKARVPERRVRVSRQGRARAWQSKGLLGQGRAGQGRTKQGQRHAYPSTTHMGTMANGKGRKKRLGRCRAKYPACLLSSSQPSRRLRPWIFALVLPRAARMLTRHSRCPLPAARCPLPAAHCKNRDLIQPAARLRLTRSLHRKPRAPIASAGRPLCDQSLAVHRVMFRGRRHRHTLGREEIHAP
jgi:hypothetical protein